MFTPYAVRGILNKYYKKEKAIDISTICDLIAYISLLGPIPRNVSFEILNLIENLTVDQIVPIPIINSLRSNLFDQTRNRQQLATTLGNLSDRLPSALNYTQLEEIKIVVSADYQKWLKVLGKFAESTSKYPIYVDSENLYIQPVNRSNVALITFYDYESKIVLIAQIHQSSQFDLESLKTEIQLLSKSHKFATFDREKMLESMLKGEASEIINLQRQGESLQKAASRVGIKLHKGQTMSDCIPTPCHRHATVTAILPLAPATSAET
ncbi:hypothetical protein CAEBREN_19966 [Caenorhabditis brenneri]|uniref:Uncharacterized protein n=1 Tax=Caenorhabditis brenneri TaxID=135651 RepID=G0ME75_CAEBE|nr:hypothetical protein CAEBREN_19966 [Caenorhabditis brenneri]